MGDSATVKWFNDGRWGTTDTRTPKFGVYRVIETSTPKSREQERALALNTELRNLF